MSEGELVDTPRGLARIHRCPATNVADASARATLVLGHGAGGSVEAPDLQRVTAAANAAGIDVVLVEQPYRVAGRKSAAPAPQLDEAWMAVLAHLGFGDHAGAGAAADAAGTDTATDATTAGAAAEPLFVGGRSSGARVACRTAAATGAAGVVALAFPLVTPKGVSRQDELDQAGVPVLIVQGESDRFGQPTADAGAQRTVVSVRGDHGLKRDLDVVSAAVVDWVNARLAG